MHQLQRSWVWSQLPSAQWNLRGGRWSSAEYSTKKEKKRRLSMYGTLTPREIVTEIEDMTAIWRSRIGCHTTGLKEVRYGRLSGAWCLFIRVGCTVHGEGYLKVKSVANGADGFPGLYAAGAERQLSHLLHHVLLLQTVDLLQHACLMCRVRN